MNRELSPVVMEVAWPAGTKYRAPRSVEFRRFPVVVTPQWMAVYLLAHIALTMLAQRYWSLTTIWALAVPLIGLAVITRGRRIDTLVVVAAYVVGAELVWRGTHARVFWEYGKYVLIVLFGLVLIRHVRDRVEWRAMLFLACLVPSLAALPIFDRQAVAFNLSGPVALGVAVLVLNDITVDRRLLLRLSAVALGPIVGLAFLATFGTLRAGPQSFVIGGKATTAGIGPNQVSSVLGLGLVLVFVLLLFGPRGRLYRLGLGAIGVWLLGQTVLSFSRGGLWTAAGAVLVCTSFIVRDRRKRRVILTLAVLGFVVFRFVVFPVTDRFTGGVVSRRLADVDLTGREKIMKADLIVFFENPVLGVGPGQSYGAHARTFRASSPHTEYTRLLAEHGSFGVLALAMLTWMVWRRLRRRERAPEKGMGLALMAWALLYMGHSAMRLAAPALMFGLGTTLIVLEGSPAGRRWRERQGRRLLPVVGPSRQQVERRGRIA
jgi:O-antigen ligase